MPASSWLHRCAAACLPASQLASQLASQPARPIAANQTAAASHCCQLNSCRLPCPASPPASHCCRRERVEAACREIGGQLVEAGQEARSSSIGSHKFSYSFLQRNWNSAWGE